ncbi:unannotated protein [freshwater metagenome]|uniref:Unannotated protein n=1 Tax=freshwater metagenome TaxID=449393 RepID=A0A6J7SXS3_9ZZZZ
MAHSHRQCAIGPWVRRHPFIRKFGVIGIIWRYRNYFLASISCFCHEVCIWRAGYRNIGSPHNQVACIPPIRRLWYICLVTKYLRGGNWKIRVPIVKREHRAAHETYESSTDCVRCHGHCRNWRKSKNTIWSVCFSGVDVCRSNDLVDFAPARSH